ncbi:FAD-dependent oxidoreductase [Actinomadura sp. DC4]|uniref:FAD-dependent oxidoreductase n=1 Tax=Actinomadura sp. DC4 TaxID=3055069 RepID=UPI0025B1843F|nr:FAD-dependent oxidoreductase [Actinomadura sp. DC4]MDN3356911.1 FAD-dependent monooxygenase [Actinomadura sp. DC4]
MLIVGAGPTGLTLACDLARRGVDVRVIEKERPAGSRGKGLQPRTLEVFEDLGVLDAITAAGAPYPPLRSYAGGEVVWEGRMHEPREPTPDVPYPTVLMVPQWRTEEILRDRLTVLGGRVEHAALTDLTQDDGGVTALLGTGDRIRAAYLVGADGGRSLVRKRLGVAFEGETHEAERMLIADVRTGDLDRDHWHMWADLAAQTLRAALCPLPGTDVFQFTSPLAGAETPEPSLATFQKILAEVSDVRLTDVGWTSVYRVNIRMAERFRDRRVFLAGDAAHVHSPAGGQGLNTGVQDAYNLGWKLAAERALDTYEEERLPVAAGVLGLSTRLYREAAERQADAHRRGEETEQLGIGYPGSSLAVGGGKAGERAPDAPLRDGRLFEVFQGTHFTLLGFGEEHAATVAEVNARYGPAVRAYTVGPAGDLADTAGHARRAYGTGGLVLVRPDGYIGVYDAPPGDYLRSLG